MGLGTIRMDRVLIKDLYAAYKVSTADYESRDFYVAIDVKNECIKFYLNSDLTESVFTIDLHNKNQPIIDIEGVHRKALLGALSRALKLVKSGIFPEKEGYSA